MSRLHFRAHFICFTYISLLPFVPDQLAVDIRISSPSPSHQHLKTAVNHKMPGLDEAGPIPAMLLTPLKAKERSFMSKLTTTSHCRVDIIDIRGASVELNLKAEIKSMLCSKNGPRELPTLLLYDERGLQLFEKASPLPAAALPRRQEELIRLRSPTWTSTT